MIQFDQVSYFLPQGYLFEKVKVQMNKGDKIGLVGKNGAGKSTLMSIVYGLYQADSGKILVNEKEIKLRSPRDSIENGIGMVHQHFMLVENFTVLEKSST